MGHIGQQRHQAEAEVLRYGKGFCKRKRQKRTFMHILSMFNNLAERSGKVQGRTNPLETSLGLFMT